MHSKIWEAVLREWTSYGKSPVEAHIRNVVNNNTASLLLMTSAEQNYRQCCNVKFGQKFDIKTENVKKYYTPGNVTKLTC